MRVYVLHNFTMDSIQKRRSWPRFIFVLIVIGAFVKDASGASIRFDALDRITDSITAENPVENDDHTLLSLLLRATLFTSTLAGRTDSKISNYPDIFSNEDQLLAQIQRVRSDRVGYLRSVVNDHRRALQLKKSSSKEFSASNEVLIDTALNRTLGNGKINSDQLDAQIIRHNLNTPMKVIQSLLSWAVVEQPADSKKHFISRIAEQLKYKPRVMKQVLTDFDFLLREESTTFVSLRQTLNGLTKSVDQVLALRQIPSANLLKVLTKEWKKLPLAIATAKPETAAEKRTHPLLIRMQVLLMCSELGIAAFRDCLYNPTKLAEFSFHVEQSQERLHRWEQHEQEIFDIVFNVLRNIEKPTDIHWRINSILPRLDSVFTKWRQLELYSTDLNRAIEETTQLIRNVNSLITGILYSNNREVALLAIERIGTIHNDDPAKKRRMELMNDDVTSNLLIEMCQTTREVLKLRVFPFHPEYLELCDNMPAPPLLNSPAFPSPVRSAEMEKRLIENIKILKSRLSRDAGQPANGTFPNKEFNKERPFYVWKSKDNKNQIKKLLSNELVTLNADILDSPKQNFAIKFTKIMLDFRFADKTKQNAFYKVINGMTIHLQMIGNNFYRCDRRTYYVPTDNDLQFIYQISINDKNEMDVSGKNPAYQTIVGRKAFLSPYSTWQIQIFAADRKENDLKKFINDEIDLELTGIGSLVLKSKALKEACEDEKLRKNYRNRVTWD